MNYDLQQLLKLDYVMNSQQRPAVLGRFVNALLTALVFPPPLSSSGLHSSDSDGHFDTPEEATPVHGPKTFPGELEKSNADPDKTGEATAEQAERRKRRESGKGGKKRLQYHLG